MLTFLLEIHFWSFNDEISINPNDFGAFKYHQKKENIKTLQFEKKKLFVCQRQYQWTLSNKKPGKLRQNVEELEEVLSSYRIIRLKWLKDNLVVLFVNSGAVVYIGVNPSSGDISNVYFDKILKDKLPSLHISDILTTNIFSVYCYNDAQLTFIHYLKPTFTKLHKKISELDPRFLSVQLPGPSGRRLPRRLSVNKNGDVIAVWWKYSDNDVFPWSPLVKDVDRANVHIYFVNGSKVELMCYHRTDHDILNLAFSSLDSHVMHLVEEKYCRDDEIYVEISSFEIVKSSRLQRSSLVSVPLRSKICCLDFSPDRSNLLLGCSNGTVVLYNQIRVLTHIVRTAFAPSIIRWHADGCVVAVASARGHLQCFDFALGAIKLQCINDDITPSNIIDLSIYLTKPATLQPSSLLEMEWSPKCAKNESSDYITESGFLLISFSNGPLIMLRIFGAAVITPGVLVNQYLKGNQVDRAVNILLAMDWDTSPTTCCNLLKDISNFVFSSCTSTPMDKFAQVQMALASFLSPVRPISHSIEAEFYKPVRDISRRLFHYLLRNNLYDLAVSVATQLNDHDLFMDLYYCASNNENSALATIAWEKAQQTLPGEETNSSPGSENCNSCCPDTSSSCEEHVDNSDNKSSIQVPLPSSTRTSFAAIARVNSTLFMNSSTGDERKQAPITSLSLNKDRPKVYTSREEKNSNSSHYRGIDTSVEVPTTTSQSQGDSNEVSELLQRAGLSENKITESKSIKVVHFGVV